MLVTATGVCGLQQAEADFGGELWVEMLYTRVCGAASLLNGAGWAERGFWNVILAAVVQGCFTQNSCHCFILLGRADRW